MTSVMNTNDDPTVAAAPAKKNPWFEFQARVRGLTHMSPPDAMRLCSALKAKKGYDEWADKEIVKFAFDWVKTAGAETESTANGGAGTGTTGLSTEEITRLEARAAKFGTATAAATEALKKEKKAPAKKKVEEDPAPAAAVTEAEPPKEKKPAAPRKKKETSPSPPAPAPAPADTAAAMKFAAEAQARADVAVTAYEEAMTKMAKATAAVEDAEIKLAEAKVCAQMAAEEVAAKMAEATSLRAAAAEAAAAAAKKAHLAAAAPLTATPSVIEHVEVAPVAVAIAETPDRRGKKAKIPKHIKNLVWNKYIGADNATGKCICCRQATISNTSFDCGHVIAEANGGDMNINNLRPICRDCNAGMGTRSMNDFTSEFFGWTV
jgi:hypothetical protein